MVKRVLVADDEPDIVELLRSFLQDHGYAVTTAANGREVLQHLATETPDLIILDVEMSVLDGLNTLQQLKSDPATADIPVVLLTAHDEDKDVATGYRAGAEVYLRKPFVPVQLLAILQLLLEPQAVL